MKTLLQASGAIALLAMALFFYRASESLSGVLGSVQQASEEVGRTAIKAQGVLATVDRAAEQQRKYWFVIDQRTSRSLKALDLAIQHTDQNLNAVLPELATAIHRNSSQVSDLVSDADSSALKLTNSSDLFLSEGAIAIHQLGLRAGDPNLPLAIAALAESSKNMNSATADIAGILSDLHHPEKPSRFLRALSFVLGLLRNAGQTSPLFK